MNLLVTANHKVDELVAHLERYIITEDVELSLVSDATLTLVTGESLKVGSKPLSLMGRSFQIIGLLRPPTGY